MRSAVIARNSMWLAIDTATSFVLSLVTSVAVARLMGPEKLGHYSYIVWAVGATGLLATVGMSGTVRKYAAEFIGRGDLATARAVIAVAFRWQMACATVITGSALAVVLWTAAPADRAYTVFAVLSIVPYLHIGVTAGAIEATQDFSANVWPSIVGNVVNLVWTVTALALQWDLVGLTSAI